jgi:hypothetical protein
MTAIVKQDGGEILEQVLIQGDLSKLKPEERVMYYKKVCESQGLNPLTKPFEYINLNGKLRLYALRDCADQLRKINGVSIIIKSREVVEGCYVVTAQATDKTGRHDEAIGAVPIDGLKGENRSNAMMKGETKAKRRVTLSICGLGWLDESETDSIPGAYPMPSAPITPTTGALAALTLDRQQVVADTASQIKAYFANEQSGDAYALYSTGGLDNDEKVALFGMLDSKVRAALKQMEQSERAQDSGKITPSQKKRLEARLQKLKIDRETVKAFCMQKWNVEHFSDLTPEQYAALDAKIDLTEKEKADAASTPAEEAA